MAYLKSQMLYDDGYYKWNAGDDKDNPYYRGGTDYDQLNRTEGYEVKYFINHYVEKRWGSNANLSIYQKIEMVIRFHIPPNIRQREHIEKWISDNWSRF
jgi:hypothetical protein